MNPSQPVALVAIPRPLLQPLSYTIPVDCQVTPGMRVAVTLGKQAIAGIVVATEQTDETAPLLEANKSFQLKSLQCVLDDASLLDTHLLALLTWAARYYHYPLGEVIFTALPVSLRKAKPLSKRAKTQLQAVNAPAVAVAGNALNLTAEQQQCLVQLQRWCAALPPRPMLLHGITGSGKTELYLHLMADVLQRDQQVLVIVPEIGLTPQLLARFARFFSHTQQVCLHSGLSDGERLQAWLQARSGQARIIIGTRSAIFTPAPALGLIIIDEEHDASLKQQDTFRYHARDLAIKRAQMLQIPVLLGTATPALESLHNALSGKFHYARLQQRPGESRSPHIQLQDARPFALQAGLTPPSLQAMRQTLARGEQVMVFLNRRGFAPALYCQSCGWQAACPHCSVNMTWHAQRNRLVCHHCGWEQITPHQCPQCAQTQLTTQGQGTERVALTLQNLFPEQEVIRIDRDTTQRKGELADKLATIHTNAPLILVGTQMLAKGHDFPNLTLVVILDTDQSLHSTDYRAMERLGQLLVQVAGRAGRAQKPGYVILQTHQPEHPLLNYLLQKGYSAFAQQLLVERQRWQCPPFVYQALLRASSTDSQAKALAFLEQIRELLTLNPVLNTLHCLGPVPAPIEKRANRYRTQLLLTCPQRAVLHQALAHLTQQAQQLRGRSSIQWSIDIDPIEFG